jgi:hypothetical protein
MKLPQGKFVKDEKGENVCHRIWFKNLFNPIFRKLGFVIVSHVEGETVIKYSFRLYPFR